MTYDLSFRTTHIALHTISTLTTRRKGKKNTRHHRAIDAIGSNTTLGPVSLVGSYLSAMNLVSDRCQRLISGRVLPIRHQDRREDADDGGSGREGSGHTLAYR